MEREEGRPARQIRELIDTRCVAPEGVFHAVDIFDKDTPKRLTEMLQQNRLLGTAGPNVVIPNGVDLYSIIGHFVHVFFHSQFED